MIIILLIYYLYNGGYIGMNDEKETMEDIEYKDLDTVQELSSLENFENSSVKYGRDFDESRRGMTGEAWGEYIKEEELEKDTFETQKKFALKIKDHSQIPAMPDRYIYNELVPIRGMSQRTMARYYGKEVKTPKVSAFATTVTSNRPEDYYN
ncbi:MAG: hypothetical protein KAS12_01435 [Candidatus Aenigmarchaeota archaeon]|nr:hypothetical protein [Candidatus Aenigmarchaeota archaeon]